MRRRTSHAGLLIDRGGDLSGKNIRWEEFPVCDQYTLQGDAFSRAIREGAAGAGAGRGGGS